jgi:hypothetical protein
MCEHQLPFSPAQLWGAMFDEVKQQNVVSDEYVERPFLEIYHPPTQTQISLHRYKTRYSTKKLDIKKGYNPNMVPDECAESFYRYHSTLPLHRYKVPCLVVTAIL